ncbi:hypothetical protein AB0M61_28170 [Streptomyces sp. NPDC051642]|uniref:hypothetical protein n=1 Tax=Streptomyces sp. NPDC051642 TaxID=3154646 RepID=UPI0034274957
MGGQADPWPSCLDVGSVRQESSDPLRFTARADDADVPLLPVARAHHRRCSVYWLTGELPPPPPEFAASHRFDETSGTAAPDATGHGRTAQLVVGTSCLAEGRVGGAVVLDGAAGHVALPEDLLAGASVCSLAGWVRLDGRPGAWSRIFASTPTRT